jgi:3-isopropylmalate/(R)-2-methylmalate dehydratase large subunit
MPSPEDTIATGQMVSEPDAIEDERRPGGLSRAFTYMRLVPVRPIAGSPVDMVLIGSYTNRRLLDLGVAACLFAEG